MTIDSTEVVAPAHIPSADSDDLQVLAGGICPGCGSEYLIETDCEDEPYGRCPGLICGTCQWGCTA